MVTISGENYITRRLISHESVVGADPSVTRCTEKLLTFIAKSMCQSKIEENDLNTAAYALVVELDRFEETLKRTTVVGRTCMSELERYKILDSELAEKKAHLHSEVEKLKVELAKEKEKRRHREECEAIAVKINEFPTREETDNRLNARREQIKLLNEKHAATVEKLEIREKQFQLLMHSIYELQNTLNEDGVEGGDNTIIDEEFLMEGDTEAMNIDTPAHQASKLSADSAVFTPRK